MYIATFVLLITWCKPLLLSGPWIIVVTIIMLIAQMVNQWLPPDYHLFTVTIWCWCCTPVKVVDYALYPPCYNITIFVLWQISHFLLQTLHDGCNGILAYYAAVWHTFWNMPYVIIMCDVWMFLNRNLDTCLWWSVINVVTVRWLSANNWRTQNSPSFSIWLLDLTSLLHIKRWLWFCTYLD